MLGAHLTSCCWDAGSMLACLAHPPPPEQEAAGNPRLEPSCLLISPHQKGIRGPGRAGIRQRQKPSSYTAQAAGMSHELRPPPPPAGAWGEDPVLP